jgi:Tfp pilus assembly protein PilF
MPSVDSIFQRHFSAATGYFELGIYDEAVRELEELPREDAERTEVLALRLVLSSALQNWEEAAGWGEMIVKVAPEVVAFWLQYAYAARRARSVEAAEKILLHAVESHPREATIRYNLGCYACVSGRLPEAKERLEEAFTMEKSLRQLALSDDDLESLRDFVKNGA